MRLPQVTQESGDEEIREVAFWDLPSRVDHALVQRIHAGDGTVALMVLRPSALTRATAQKNIDRWRQELRRWRVFSHALQGQRPVWLTVVTQCDQLSECDISGPDAEQITKALGVEKVLVTSAKSGQGIAELREAILAAINWQTATWFPSIEVFDRLIDVVLKLRNQRRFLLSLRELHDVFLRDYPILNEYVRSEKEFKDGVRLLEVRGEVYLFDYSEEVLLFPGYYRTYASAMIAGAEKDDPEMGRLPLKQARSGLGEKMNIAESDRLPDQKQQARLLALTIQEMRERKVAQEVSTDGVSYLVFPRSLTKMRDPSLPRPAFVTRCRFVGQPGALDDIFS